MTKQNKLEQYEEIRKDYIYYKVVKRIIKLFSGNDKTIIDIGSANIDLMSELPFKKRCSVAIYGAINNDKVTGYQMNFFDFKPEEKFDVVTCLQVIEHIEEAREFTQKIFNTGKTVIISLPYKWKKGTCKTHIQDPVDESKIYSWTSRNPNFSFYIKDNKGYGWRIICVYGKLNFKQKVSLILLTIKYVKNFILKNGIIYNNLLEMIFSVKNDKDSCHKIFTILGIKIKFKSEKLKNKQVNYE